jgi:hypothetical protein
VRDKKHRSDGDADRDGSREEFGHGDSFPAGDVKLWIDKI